MSKNLTQSLIVPRRPVCFKKTYKFNSKEKFDYPRDFITCNFEYIILHENRVHVYKKMLR